MTRCAYIFLDDQKNDPPDYSVAGESTLGTLVIRGEPFDVGLDESHPTAPPDHPMPSSGEDLN